MSIGRSAIVVAATVIGGGVLAPLLAPAVVGILGFSAAGPVAGTFAAAAQAGIGNVVAGSIFAGAQSVAMGGALPLLGTVIGGGVSGATALVASIASRR